MLGGILKKKTKAVVVGDDGAVDKSVLNRRLKGVLERPTRRELNPPKLSPEDYYQAGFAEAPPAMYARKATEPEDDGAVEAEAGAAVPPPADEGRAPQAADPIAETLKDDAMARIMAAVTEAPEPEDTPADTVVPEAVESAAPEAGAEEIAEAEVPQAVLAAEEPVGADEPVANEIMAGDAAPDAGETPVADTADGEVPPVTAIYVSPEAMASDDPAAVTEFVIEELDYLLFDAGYGPDELPRAGMLAWCANFFASSGTKDGIGAFAHDTMGEPDLWETCAEGLMAVGATAHLRVFEDLRALLTKDANIARQLGDDREFGSGDPHVTALDKALKEAEAAAPLAPVVGAWLKRQPELEQLEEAALEAAVTALASHPALAARQVARMAEAG